LETILTDLKIRLEGLSRRSASTPIPSSAGGGHGYGHVSGSTTPNNNYYTPNSASSFFPRA